MSSGSVLPKEVLSERLAEVRASTLSESEKIVAQQMGDTGQAIVLTETRLIILKAGLTATGSIERENVTSFAFDKIETVNLRRGPMGAVFQVIGKNRNTEPGNRPPENVVVFSGEAKVKKLEILSDKFSNISKLPVTRVDWSPDPMQSEYPLADKAEISEVVKPETESEVKKPKKQSKPQETENQNAVPSFDCVADVTESHQEAEQTEHNEQKEEQPLLQENGIEFDLSGIGLIEQPIVMKSQMKPSSKSKEKISLAEEIYGELMEDENRPAPAAKRPKPAPTVQKIPAVEPEPFQVQAQNELRAPVVEQALIEDDWAAEEENYGHNPKLEAYLPKKKNTPIAVIIGIAALLLLLFAGMAIMNRNMLRDANTGERDSFSTNASRMAKNRKEIADYRASIAGLIAASDADSASLQRAISARDVNAIKSSVSTVNHEKLLVKLREIKPPVGLQTAQGILESGITERKAVATALSNALSGAGTVEQSSTLGRLKAADGKVRTALDRVNSLETPE